MANRPWNAPKGRRGWLKRNPDPRQRAEIPRRVRAKIRGRLKRRFGLTRREMGEPLRSSGR